MKKTIAFILMMSFLGTFNVHVSAETVKNIYVSSLTGSDSNKGTTEDKPFKTLEKAMAKATSYKTTGADVVNIFMDDGVYELSETMNIVAGNDKTTINYKAKGDVIFKGSKVIPVSAFSFLDDEEIKEKLNDDIESNVNDELLMKIFTYLYHIGKLLGLEDREILDACYMKLGKNIERLNSDY